METKLGRPFRPVLVRKGRLYGEKGGLLAQMQMTKFASRKGETWGQYDEDIKVLFLMGLEEDNTVRTEKLEEEIKHYGDIVQGNFLDTYHNLTYKHVMGLKYVVYHCPVAKFIFKVDDDVFVNVPILKQFIISYVYENGRPTKIFCSRFHHNPVLRSGKWATSVEDFPENYYPDHCSGFAILYPKELIFPLYTVAQKSKFFWVDDVFVSGICAQKLNISHIGIENLVLSNTDILKIVDLSFTNVTTHFLIGRMNLSENEIRSLWKFVISSIHEKLLKINALTYTGDIYPLLTCKCIAEGTLIWFYENPFPSKPPIKC
ncbi:hypothetical protein NQ315_012089 [Exocentrus adspersus]|uniref:Hexosyltransferase n=1 Tax=Exocentrus adspersus TaxID=1586481 RepID=A0AAV8VXV9_9CUCU|nr:hypothetical protein NQ315_012089 [Exocentrus adspersus]